MPQGKNICQKKYNSLTVVELNSLGRILTLIRRSALSAIERVMLSRYVATAMTREKYESPVVRSLLAYAKQFRLR